MSSPSLALAVGAECADQLKAVHKLLRAKELEMAQIRRQNQELRQAKEIAENRVTYVCVCARACAGGVGWVGAWVGVTVSNSG